jgi:hypothetical protein
MRNLTQLEMEIETKFNFESISKLMDLYQQVRLFTNTVGHRILLVSKRLLIRDLLEQIINSSLARGRLGDSEL